MVCVSLASCIPVVPSLPNDPVYLHRPDESTFEFVVCREARASTLIVEFHEVGDRLLEYWQADSAVAQDFVPADVISVDSLPAGFVADGPLSVPETFYSVTFSLATKSETGYRDSISGTFFNSSVSGSRWRDQEGNLVDPHC